MYTRVWTDAISGANPANTIDTLLSNIREDLNERLTTFALSSMDSIAMDAISDLTVKSTTDWALRMHLGFVTNSNILFVDKTVSGYGRVQLGHSSSAGNIVWSMLVSVDAASFPAYESALNGLVAVKQDTGQLVYYGNGSRWALNGTPF